MSQERMQSNQFDCLLKSVHLWVTHEKNCPHQINLKHLKYKNSLT